ncbi:MAG: alpha-L-fucosidase [Bryobacterales bacterium]|jgi:alpha-L-fucosidase|nr:alpha-L-fucosidase [Bryobacterales bacterium]
MKLQPEMLKPHHRFAISRRALMRMVPLAGLAATPGLAMAQSFADTKPKPQQLAWQALELGVLIHFGPNTFQDREWGDGKADPSIFNPTQLDAEQWVLAAKAGGAGYLVMVAKHHDGFCLWPSRHTEYSVKNSPWRDGKGDLVKEVEQACRKHGLRFGIYLSPWDRHEPSYSDNARYDDYYNKQLTELCTRYGELVEIWLDGAGSEGHVYDFDRYVKTMRTYQPNANIFADTGFLQYGDVRWVGNEDGYAHEDNWNVVDRLGYLRYRPAEADTPLRQGHWFWHPHAEQRLKTLPQMMETYEKTVGRGAQLVLGLAPDDRGLMPDVDVARLQEFGDGVQAVYGDPLLGRGNNLSGVSGTGLQSGVQVIPPNRDFLLDGRPHTHMAPPPTDRGMDLVIQLREPVRFDRIQLMEWLGDGQTIAAHSVRANVGSDSQAQWREIARGTTIGHKRIHAIEPVTARGLVLIIEDAIGPIRLSGFQVFDSKGR